MRAMQEKAALNEEKKQHGVDLDGVRFARMVESERALLLESEEPPYPPLRRGEDADIPTCRVSVMVRKRPVSAKEFALKQCDVVTALRDSGHMVVHEPKVSVDMSRRVESSAFAFDGAFGEDSTNDEVYASAVAPLVRLCLEGQGAHATCFAYGQTGSGKTYTMKACYRAVAEELVEGAERCGLSLWVSFYDIYAGKCYDLLSSRKQLSALEDKRGRVRLVGLLETKVKSAREVMTAVERGMACRKTSRTDSNVNSSRSHSIFQVVLRPADAMDSKTPAMSRLSLVDLAGSERGADRGKAVDGKIRQEGAEINKSLLALKECIRALSSSGGGGGVNAVSEGVDPREDLGGDDRHVPFRGSQLTKVLRDAFVGAKSKTVLLAHVAPTSVAAEHTMNTLRYALRLKDGISGGKENDRARGNGNGNGDGSGGSSPSKGKASDPPTPTRSSPDEGRRVGLAVRVNESGAGMFGGVETSSPRALDDALGVDADDVDDADDADDDDADADGFRTPEELARDEVTVARSAAANVAARALDESNAASRDVERAGLALEATHARFIEVVREENELLLSEPADASAHYEYCDQLESVLRKRAAMGGMLQDAIAVLKSKRAVAEEKEKDAIEKAAAVA